jgi:hypothetical protein
MRDRVINACKGIKACVYACLKPAPTLEGLCSDLRSSISAHESLQESAQAPSNQAFYTDRRYHTGGRPQNRPGRPYNHGGGYNGGHGDRRNGKKRCFVCQKEGCWSTKHTKEERERSVENFKQRFRKSFDQEIDRRVRQYIAGYEGCYAST